MKKIMVITSLIILSTVSVQAKQINVKDFEVSPGGMDCTAGLLKALDACKKQPSAELVFPKGEYHFYPDFGIDKFFYLSNNDEGLKRIIFPLDGFNNLTIEGNGSSFVFHGFVNPFIIENSVNVTFRNFSVDYSRSFHSEAIILANNPDGIDVEIPENFPYSISYGKLVFTDGLTNEERKTAISRRYWYYPYGALLEFDAKKRETAFMANDFHSDGYPLVAENIGERKVRLHKDKLQGTVGNIMVFGSANRNYPGFVINDSRDISFKNITLYHTGGMGILGQRSHNILVDSCKFTPSTGRIISCTADATHFVNCTGKIELSHCLFENQLDDATNIHGIYVQIVKQIKPNELLVQLKHDQQVGFDFLKKGTKIELVKGKSMITKGTAEVIEAERLNKDFTRIVISKDLPKEIIVGDVIAELRDYPEVYIHDNIIRKNRARGILLNSRGKTIVENNYFHTSGAAILFEGDGTNWFEQGGVSDCTIRNNIFDDCKYGRWSRGVIFVGSGIREDSKISRYHKNIKIYDNTFRTSEKVLLLNIKGVDGLTWKDNKIENVETYPFTDKVDSYFKVVDCDNVVIDSKTY